MEKLNFWGLSLDAISKISIGTALVGVILMTIDCEYEQLKWSIYMFGAGLTTPTTKGWVDNPVVCSIVRFGLLIGPPGGYFIMVTDYGDSGEDRQK